MSDIIKQIVVGIIIAIVTALIVGPMATKMTLEYTKKVEISYTQFEGIITSLWELESLLSELMEKYNIPAEKANELLLKISEDEKKKC